MLQVRPVPQVREYSSALFRSFGEGVEFMRRAGQELGQRRRETKLTMDSIALLRNA